MVPFMTANIAKMMEGAVLCSRGGTYYLLQPSISYHIVSYRFCQDLNAALISLGCPHLVDCRLCEPSIKGGFRKFFIYSST